MNKGEHLTEEGLNKILNLKASMNKGLSEQLKELFPNVVPVQRPELDNHHLVSDVNWLVGFTEAEGCFLCLVRKNPSHKIGYQVTLSFNLTQHIRDFKLMQKIQERWGFGKLNQTSSAVSLTITKKSDIDKLIAIFSNYGLIGSKRLDFEDFYKIQQIVNKELHKTEEGLKEIIMIKNKMNSKRNYEN